MVLLRLMRILQGRNPPSIKLFDHHGPIKIRDTAADYDFLKAEVSDTHRISICYPAYAPGDDMLLTLSVLDCPEGGIHHGFALIAAGKHPTRILAPDPTSSSVVIATGPLVASML